MRKRTNRRTRREPYSDRLKPVSYFLKMLHKETRDDPSGRRLFRGVPTAPPFDYAYSYAYSGAAS